MKNKQRKNGITLIALVVTIVVLLILAGVTIAMLTGENGIIERAKEAREKTKEGAEKENSILKQYEEILGTGGVKLPQNTEETEAGTIVEMPDEWYTQTPKYVSETNGTEVVPSKRTANVYGVSDGTATTVPVPYGFYYVGGTVASGVVISDNPSDKDKYKGQTDVPAGVVYNTDGTVNIEKSPLKGNQFVWIPCSESNYTKVDLKTNDVVWDKETNTSELSQIEKYKGFYIGRYEAGTSEIELKNNVKFENTSTTQTLTEGKWTSIWHSPDFLSSNVTKGKITTKAGEIPYYHADYTTAVEMSKNMYDTDYVQSGLITGTMWDVVMKFITTDNTNYSDLKSSDWGNYNASSSNVRYTAGQGRYAEVNLSNGSVTKAFTVADNSFHYGIRTTASTENVKRSNIYDLAGNLWEWTQEMGVRQETDLQNILCYNLRGGSFYNTFSGCPVCFRGGDVASHASTSYGFRPALYIK